jgi:probable selenium-dependent hydroxylase accessory protein YqeC
MVTLREGLMLGKRGVISLVGSGGKTSLMFRLARELVAAGEPVLTTTTTKIFEPGPDQSARLILSGSASEILEKAREALKQHRHITAGAEKIPEQGKLRGFEPAIIHKIWESRLFRWIIVEADGAAGRPLKAPAMHEPVTPACTTHIVGMVGLSGAGQPLTDRWVFRPQRFIDLSGLLPEATVTEDTIAAVLVHEDGIFKGAPFDAVRVVFCNQADVPRNRAAGQRLVQALILAENTGLNRILIGQTMFAPPVLEMYDLKAETQHESSLD